MLNVLTYLLDPYERKARRYPALLCGLPLLVSVVLLIPEFGAVWGAIGGFAIFCGGTTFLAQITRDRGKTMEPKLYALWGGKPSVAMLRHADSRLNPSTKNRYRTFLQRVVPELTLASVEEEQANFKGADQGYESTISWLLARTRDRERFGLLFRENINYGFRRNIWALKPWAFAMEAIALVIIGISVLELWTGEFLASIQMLGMETWASLILTIIHVLFFTFRINNEWVRIAAETYARQLLSTCDLLEDGHEV